MHWLIQTQYLPDGRYSTCKATRVNKLRVRFVKWLVPKLLPPSTEEVEITTTAR